MPDVKATLEQLGLDLVVFTGMTFFGAATNVPLLVALFVALVAAVVTHTMVWPTISQDD